MFRMSFNYVRPGQHLEHLYNVTFSNTLLHLTLSSLLQYIDCSTAHLPHNDTSNGNKSRVPLKCLEGWHLQYIIVPIPLYSTASLTLDLDNKVVFCTGGAGTICSVQVKALIYLGANAFIIGRNASKTESMAKEMALLRPGAKVIGMGNLDVRKIEDMNKAVERCVQELGGIDYVM